MTTPALPTTPGSCVTDEQGDRFACVVLFRDLVRWVPLTRWSRRSLTPEEMAARGPVVDWTAPEWAEPDRLAER